MAEKYDRKVGNEEFFSPGFVDFAAGDRLDVKNACEPRADACAPGSRVDLSEDRYGPRSLRERERGDCSFDGGPVFEKLLDRLFNTDLGPAGFFIVCHRG